VKVSDTSPFIARQADVDVLENLWTQAKTGDSHVVRLQAPFGGGRRAVSSEFLRTVQGGQDDAIVWRVACADQENGLQWLVRMYGALVAGLTGDVLKRGKVEMLLNSQLPGEPKRVQGWYQSFITTLKDAKTDKEKGQVQLQLPKDNPLVGLVEIVTGISRKIPIVLELQNPQAVNSLALGAFLETLATEATTNECRLLVIVHDEEPSDITKALFPLPLLDVYERQEFDVHVIAPWTGDEVRQFASTRDIEVKNADRVAEIAGGRPGFVSEILTIAGERDLLGTDLEGVTLASLAPVTPDESELEAPEGEPEEGKRTHATAEDASKIAFYAALLGQAFPSSLVADMGNFERDSVDDMLDALEDLFEEVQFAKDMGTWIYKFKRGSWREGVIQANDTDEGHEVARRVGQFMERFLVPRGYGFIVKTARVYAENGALNRASHLRAVALTNDNADIWGLSYDLLNYFDEINWPDPLRRTVFINLLDRLVGSGPIPSAEKVHQDATEWASKNEDRDLTAWLLFAGSRLDLRRQDLFRARDRAQDAIKLYEALENGARVAECYNHLAAIELQDGNPNAALEQVNKAIEAGQIPGPEGKPAIQPGILAHAEQIRGLVQRRSGKPKEAAEHFRKANEIAGQVGMAPLALDSGLSFGEALLSSGQTKDARDVLRQVIGIAQQLRNAPRERSACELLAQAEGALKDWSAATKAATRTLQLSQALKIENALPIDLYNLGFFHFANEKPNEALTFFKQSEQRIARLGQHPVVKELYYFMGLAHMKAGNLQDARSSLTTGLSMARESKDFRKVVSCMDNLAGIAHKSGDDGQAADLLDQAIDLAGKQGLKEQRKALRKKREGLSAH
jgi:tetratricopeptide (TPR) repeat protein